MDTYLVTATLGQRGWMGNPDENPGFEALGNIRRRELQSATEALGLKNVLLLDYMDGDLDQVDPDEIISTIAAHIREIRPQVVVTFDPFGVYGHPDHIAISQFTNAAIIAAAYSNNNNDIGGIPHMVAKLYYIAETDRSLGAYQEAFGKLTMTVDNITRREVAWPDWSITSVIDTSNYQDQVWQAVHCHRSQLSAYQALSDLPEEQRNSLFDRLSFYRVFSLVNAGRQLETDLFSGLR